MQTADKSSTSPTSRWDEMVAREESDLCMLFEEETDERLMAQVEATLNLIQLDPSSRCDLASSKNASQARPDSSPSSPDLISELERRTPLRHVEPDLVPTVIGGSKSSATNPSPTASTSILAAVNSFNQQHREHFQEFESIRQAWAENEAQRRLLRELRKAMGQKEWPLGKIRIEAILAEHPERCALLRELKDHSYSLRQVYFEDYYIVRKDELELFDSSSESESPPGPLDWCSATSWWNMLP